jgi:hypothetical protein
MKTIKDYTDYACTLMRQFHIIMAALLLLAHIPIHHPHRHFHTFVPTLTKLKGSQHAFVDESTALMDSAIRAHSYTAGALVPFFRSFAVFLRIASVSDCLCSACVRLCLQVREKKCVCVCKEEGQS